MDILIAGVEFLPYVAKGSETSQSSAQIIGPLAKALVQLGNEVTVALPYTDSLKDSGLMPARRLTPLRLPGDSEVIVYDVRLPSGVKLVLFEQDGCFRGEAAFGSENFDEEKRTAQLAHRLGVFGGSVRALWEQRAKAQQPYDVVHLFDWAAAPVALGGIQSRLILSICDMAQHGSFASKYAEALGIPKERLSEARAGNRVNALKAGISGADIIALPSEVLAGELLADQQSSFGKWLNDRSDAVVGVRLGVDYSIYNPATDPALNHRYDAEDASGKGACKTALLRKLGLDLEPERPLIGFPGELTKASGGDWLIAAIPQLLQNDLVLVVGDRGDEALLQKLGVLLERYPDQLKQLKGLQGSNGDEARRQLASACDLWLLAPRADYFGVDLMLGERYGAVPIVHAVGVMAEQVVDADEQLATGTGFLFEASSKTKTITEKAMAKALAAAVSRGVAAFGRADWPKLRRRVLRLDTSWDGPARRYLQLYR